MDLKKTLLVLFCSLFFTSSLVFAATEKFIIEEGAGIKFQGKNITFIGAEGLDANFLIDGEYGTVTKGEMKVVSGVNITVAGLSLQPPIVIINASAEFTCGNGNCELTLGERIGVCCSDCGCGLPTQRCVNNMCILNVTEPTSTYECQIDGDCEAPDELCVIPWCDTTITPYICSTQTITACVGGDECCPPGCSDTDDADCKTINMCLTDEDCEDDDVCSINTCEGTPKRCEIFEQQGCDVDGRCVLLAQQENLKYCDINGDMMFLKDKGALCLQDFECLTGRCRSNTCSTGILADIYHYILIGIVVLFVGLISFYIYLAMDKQKKEQKPST
jgi:hypothetical protein